MAGERPELKNACERLVILCRGTEASLEDLPTPPAKSWQGALPSFGGGGDLPTLPPEGLSLIDLEKQVIEMVLRLKRWNITQAAAYLRVPRHILVYRIEKYGLRRDA